MLAPITHILPLTSLTRGRTLPGFAHVLVKAGQKVKATDVIAEMPAERRHIIIDVWQVLKPGKKNVGINLVNHKAGEKIKKGDVIAETGGMFSKVVRAPADCEIVAVGGNQVMLEIEGGKIEVKAGFSGTVKEILADRGALIESTGALIQGVWGNNRLAMGVLVNMAHSPGELLTRERMDVSMRGAVVFAGHCDRAEVLLGANELGIAGLILGSMTSDLVPTALQIDMPVLLLEGFGTQPINSFAYRLLTTSEKRDVCINAAAPEPIYGIRPEVFIELPAEGEPARELVEFSEGQEVRIIGKPHESVVGTLEEILPMPVALSNKLKTRAAIIRLEDSQEVIIPLSNLDVIE
jgi:biotin carboxyl carrier protein